MAVSLKIGHALECASKERDTYIQFDPFCVNSQLILIVGSSPNPAEIVSCKSLSIESAALSRGEWGLFWDFGPT